ncbi:hypothetical protein A2165_02145 [Candidatus Curtissbacteria bacterium RBG_13_40_7]|uniref:Uncharacterized protein n=1 Tax=Candidatus Curtissbacteria bacterium RBG_13_40_7 TaxID=1797706 RepID=A0A1F5FYW4_9BACT|nr:MAG: hypothetical protein A2165_02145 [Candidatus Curtissbacteria bacterium RBG_13_40_7]
MTMPESDSRDPFLLNGIVLTPALEREIQGLLSDREEVGPINVSAVTRVIDKVRAQLRFSHFDDPPFVVPKEFLMNSLDATVAVGKLTQVPDLELLEWVPTLNHEVALIYRESTWFIIKGLPAEIPCWLRFNDSAIDIHSHPVCYGGLSIPSPVDFGGCLLNGSNFVVGNEGLCQYWPILSEEDGHRLDEHEITAGLGERPNFREYLAYLLQIGARFRFCPWRSLDNEKLSAMLQI